MQPTNTIRMASWALTFILIVRLLIVGLINLSYMFLKDKSFFVAWRKIHIIIVECDIDMHMIKGNLFREMCLSDSNIC